MFTNKYTHICKYTCVYIYAHIYITESLCYTPETNTTPCKSTILRLKKDCIPVGMCRMWISSAYFREA